VGINSWLRNSADIYFVRINVNQNIEEKINSMKKLGYARFAEKNSRQISIKKNLPVVEVVLMF